MDKFKWKSISESTISEYTFLLTHNTQTVLCETLSRHSLTCDRNKLMQNCQHNFALTLSPFSPGIPGIPGNPDRPLKQMKTQITSYARQRQL